MKITKIKAIENGLKGIELTYVLPQVKGGLTFENEFIVTYKSPVHAELRLALNALEPHFRSIMNLKDTSEVKINGVSTSGGRCMILAKLIVLDSYTSACNTPSLDEDCPYGQWDAMVECVAEVHKQADIYVYHDGMAKPKQYMLDLFDAGEKTMKGLTREDVEKWAAEEDYDMMKNVLEQKGAIVTLPEDIGPQEEDYADEVVPATMKVS